MKDLKTHFEENENLEEKFKRDALYSNLLDKDLPNLSILIPTFNRRKFIPLIAVNLLSTDYPKNKLEVVIYDDNPDNPLFLNSQETIEFSKQIGIFVNYIYNPKRHLSIGEKRNKLVKEAKYKTLINLDDDDMYFPTYFRYSVSTLINNKVGIVGSNEMIFVFPHNNFDICGISCQSKRQAHEATFCYTKKYWKNMGGFSKTNRGEGSKMIDYNEQNCHLTDIRKCMMCLVHTENTIDKNMFYEKENKIDFVIPDEYKDLINEIIFPH